MCTMADQLDLFPENKDWDEALTDYCEAKIREYLDKTAFYAIYTMPDSERLHYVGPYDDSKDAEQAMNEYDGELVLKATYREIEQFLKHNNKSVTH